MDLDSLKLMGLAIYNGTILDIRFPPCCYKKLLFSHPNKLSSADKGSLGQVAESCGGETMPGNKCPLELTLHDLSEVMPVS